MATLSRLDVDLRSEEAVKAYEGRDFDTALALMNEAISQSPESARGVTFRHLRALACESGNVPGGVSLDDALADYKFLADRSEQIGSVGLVGAARVLKKQDPVANLDRAEELCMDALSIDASAEALSLLGDLCAESRKDEPGARSWYWKAYRAGSIDGLLDLAKSHEREGHRLRAAAFAMIYGLKSGPGDGVN